MSALNNFILGKINEFFYIYFNYLMFRMRNSDLEICVNLLRISLKVVHESTWDSKSPV